MKAKAKHDISTSKNNRSIFIQKGQLLDVVLDEDRSDESGEIRLNGEYLCDNHSPFAQKHFLLLDEAESEHAESIQLEQLCEKPASEFTPADIDWLLAQAKAAQHQREWLNKIAEIDKDAFTLTDAQYWALLGLEKV